MLKYIYQSIFAFLISLLSLTILACNVSDKSDSAQQQTKINQEIITLYQSNCSRCHGAHGEGFADFPQLKEQELPVEYIKDIVQNGGGDMPAFRNIKGDQLTQLAEYVHAL